jgi:APA family basic amino acid/polyamine antiporter
MGTKIATEQGQLFVRQATGLVRSWSIFDAFIYSFFSVNLVTLGMSIFASSPFIPRGNLLLAILISAVFLIFECILYSQLISAMPRSGGDYVWQSRVLGGGIGYILAMTGWVFILWHWVPIYGSMLADEFVVPMLLILGHAFSSAALINLGLWFTTSAGLFIMSLVTIGLATMYIALGMAWYSRMQKTMWYIAMAGLVLLFILLAVSNPTEFATRFNQFLQDTLGIKNAYHSVIQAANQGGYHPVAISNWQLGPSLLLIPMVLFFNLWPNWGSTLYGEVRGASEYRRNLAGMLWGLGVTTVLAIVFLLLVNKGIGWEFYERANWAFYSAPKAMPMFPYPALLASIATSSPILQVLLILLMGAWFFGWCGTVFLSSTRVIFAAAFDRMAPERLAEVSGSRRVPVWALMVMMIPSLIIAMLYAFVPGFSGYTLDATVVIAIMYLGTAIAGILLPYRNRALYESSPIARYRVFGIPLITLSGIIFTAFLLFALYEWITNPVYGVNSRGSAVYMIVLYLVAAIIYFIYRGLRKRQGINIKETYGSIPVE